MGPSRWWYAVAALVAVGGLAVAGVLGVRAVVDFSDRVDDLDRVPIFATEEVSLDEGAYTLYYEQPSRSVVVVVPPVDPGFECEGDFDPRLEEYDSDVTYDVDGREGTAVASFDIPAPTRCTLTPAVPAGDQELGAQVAVGPSVYRGPLQQGFVAGAVALTAILAAAAITLFTGLGRVRAKRPGASPR